MSGLTKDEITRAHEACLTEYKKLCLECVSEQDYQIGWMDCTRSQADRLRTADELFDAVDWKVFCQLLCRADHNIEAIAINKLHAAYLKARDTK